MKIQSILLRVGGSKVDIDGIEYHFEPLEDGCHVAEVENEDHVDTFLAISEAYKVYRGDLSPEGVPAKVAGGQPKTNEKTTMQESLLGSSAHEPSYEIGGVQHDIESIVDTAFKASGMTAEAWNELSEEERGEKIDAVLDELADAAETPSQGGDDREALVAQYKEKFGKSPHYRLSAEKIKAELDAAE